MDGVYVILISSSLARVAKGLKGEQRMVTVELWIIYAQSLESIELFCYH